MPKGSGRRPLPTAVKKLRGNPGKRKLNDKEPSPRSGDPVMPRGLSKEAAKEWRAIVPELREMGVLTKIDGKALAAYCHSYARWMEAEEEIRRVGIVVQEPIWDQTSGRLMGVKFKKNPAVTISETAMKIMKSFLVEFGMTPSSRSRVRIEKPTEGDELEEFLKGSAAIGPGKHVN
jgi:P27 family predicted phage terminase small subunit